MLGLRIHHTRRKFSTLPEPHGSRDISASTRSHLHSQCHQPNWRSHDLHALPQPCPRWQTSAPPHHWCPQEWLWSCPSQLLSGQCWRYSGHSQIAADPRWQRRKAPHEQGRWLEAHWELRVLCLLWGFGFWLFGFGIPPLPLTRYMSLDEFLPLPELSYPI